MPVTAIQGFCVKHAVLAAALAAALPSLQASPAHAQDAPTIARATELDGIVVTGSKRDTPYLRSDISVTVLDRDALQQANVTEFRDLDKLAPNVKFNVMGQLSDMFISIRGIESNPFLVNRASVYIDGIPFRELSNAVLNHVESVEILRGPQGTLYGANSESGLVLVRTRAPSATTEGEVNLRATHFGNGHGTSVDGFLGGALGSSNRLFGSLAFMASDEDSHLKNLTPFDGIPGKVKETYLQGKLRWEPTDTLSINAIAYHLGTRAPGMFEYEYLPLDVGLYNQRYADLYNGGRHAGDFTYINDAPKRTSKTENVAGASAQWQLARGTVDAAVSYREQRDTSGGYDFDMTNTPALAGRIHDAQRNWNGELRFSSLDDQPLTWIGGVSTYRVNKDSVLGTRVGPRRAGWKATCWRRCRGRTGRTTACSARSAIPRRPCQNLPPVLACATNKPDVPPAKARANWTWARADWCSTATPNCRIPSPPPCPACRCAMTPRTRCRSTRPRPRATSPAASTWPPRRTTWSTTRCCATNRK